MTEKTASSQPPFSATREYGVPRRFSVGTILMVTAGFAVLFGGTKPRRASMITGIAILFTWALLWFVTVSIVNNRIRIGYSLDQTVSLLAYCAAVIIFGGGAFGYFAGLLVSSVFLLRDGLERMLSHRTRSLGDASTPEANEPDASLPMPKH